MSFRSHRCLFITVLATVLIGSPASLSAQTVQTDGRTAQTIIRWTRSSKARFPWRAMVSPSAWNTIRIRAVMGVESFWYAASSGSSGWPRMKSMNSRLLKSLMVSAILKMSSFSERLRTQED